MTEITKDWCINMAKAEEAAGDPEIGAGLTPRCFQLYSVCPACDVPDTSNPYDGQRQFGDFDKCPKCGEVMDVWTESGVRNEQNRREV